MPFYGRNCLARGRNDRTGRQQSSTATPGRRGWAQREQGDEMDQARLHSPFLPHQPAVETLKRCTWAAGVGSGRRFCENARMQKTPQPRWSGSCLDHWRVALDDAVMMLCRLWKGETERPRTMGFRLTVDAWVANLQVGFASYAYDISGLTVLWFPIIHCKRPIFLLLD